MSLELFNQLEQKVQNAVETIEMLKMEAEELREENTRLKQERDEWERRLNGLLGKFQDIEDDASDNSQNQ
ncbi:MULTISPECIES: cell division protein ZapB [Chromohalobacter]|uniref:Cell division protein ZapB n=1 Tax=Chromohalobacter canadensis TaxID=141389 RepID=A0A285VHT7_9GAMM|nr:MULTISPECIES: cell division protein ZapB [Chromohalobacter]NWO10637.1 cell division protein ZapB [Chromohalobacter salexigens]MCK0767188.1 cell division protein ZapB [Chromohalobacter canadensis]MCT8468239.1 cell division protein ZapB [Chromohalobacter canadensis]MCT8471294.1 cell division protein ZapB [Chromohalobacter canadensis]MCT8498747.1 cell division protein ZapB [Chromohalobacter canadensis]